MKDLQVGLIGYGMGGQVFHAPFIDVVSGMQLAMIRETNPSHISLAKERYPHVQIVSQSEEILKNESIDLVVVATPNKMHFPLAKEALLAGKHVLVEKPFTVTTKEADELIALAAQENLLLTVNQNRRWDSDFMTVRSVIESGKLGRLVEYEVHYDRYLNALRPDTWKEEGSLGTGFLYDLGSHIIDQVLLLFGLPEEVTGFIGKQRDNSRIVDSFEIILGYSGLKVTLKSGFLVKAHLPKYILLGTEGSFIKYGLDVQEDALKEGTIPTDEETWRKEPEDIWGTIDTESEGQSVVESLPGNYKALYENLVLALRGDQELAVQPFQARNVIRIIELAMQSSEEKRTLPYS